ncbi:MAG: putative selenium-dependent hydroxylase accessory protein YqeC [Thermoanaerobaculales bacterium]|nr:putative selenium-dependent hydroxylase accessory protein YqeC [Thermoanaerobaculales bacterium]
MNPSITENLGLASERVINLMGGGGKTTLMFSLAHELVAQGERVITTTTTKIFMPDPLVAPLILFGSDPNRAREQLRRRLQTTNHVIVALEKLPNNKLAGIGPEVVDELGREGVADRILVEADGSAGRSLKAHADHEPVISPAADLVVVVIGVDCIGARLDDGAVHRSALFAHRIGRPTGSTITIHDVAAIVHHRNGYLAKIPTSARVVVLLNKVDAETEPVALKCAHALYRADPGQRLDRIVLGSVKVQAPWLRVVPR